MTNKTSLITLEPITPILTRYKGRGRDALLPLLHEVQAEYGWLPREVQKAVGELLRIPLADIHGVIEFYTMFYNEPTGKTVIRVCTDLACRLAGCEKAMASFEEQLGLQNGETDLLAGITLEYVPCLGMCESAPAAQVGDRATGGLNADSRLSFMDGSYPNVEPRVYGNPIYRLAHIGKIDPSSLNDYVSTGGYDALKRVVNMNPEDVIEIIDKSGILGRGGAMFPLGRKWRFTRNAPQGEKHIVVNADESEPGTFKDRTIMEGDPFAVVEAATVAAYAVGAEKGWIFIRGEYPLSFARLSEAVKKARSAGFLGKDILGVKGFNFDIEIRLGAGAYICGEETALFEAIEGKRGFPRIKPPFPTTNGLFNQPTAINNVETLIAALVVLHVGLDEWHSHGTKESPGTKLFCLSGHVSQPGLYEVPFGITIGELIQIAGGVIEDRDIQAILLGGAAGVFIGPEMLDMPLTYEAAQANNVPLGSGVIMVFDNTVNMREVFSQIGHFFAHESCGKCYPCQIGTQRQAEILGRIAMGNGTQPTDRQMLLDIGFTMTETSLCGLGQTAASAVKSAITLWPEIFA